MSQQQSNNICAISNKLQVLLYSLYSLHTGIKYLPYFPQGVPYFSTSIFYQQQHTILFFKYAAYHQIKNLE